MLGPDLTVQAVATAAAPPMQPSRSPAEPRVVEGLAKARVRQQSTSATLAPPPSSLQQLSASARQFADLLDATGSLFVAASVSGFRAGQLDVYA